ncbi:TetR/AcrR family transcriptional regulator [Nocardiopsis suaedae]|uniref:TetR/AcrR family transcriptional regulator n=1 Tax=Nocardiopsis suaedae TaxID=3018444 RepID=A0ABT4TQ98_9ACTN|nr:TetR/AcrR family transcriptional regulator [Nocardiopsis suaedae]MDA2806867.1 TetR/AcrR family transcriptional regulator [Nocardiopsis suaedae]
MHHDNRGAAQGDRRDALKARHRRAIVGAASDLMHETDGAHFTVDQLAERADVSRRTVFNHFGSLDEVVLEVLSGELEAIVDGIDAFLAGVPVGPGGQIRLLDRLVDAVRDGGLVELIPRLKRILGGDRPEPGPRQAMLFERAFTDLNARLAATLRRHHPGLAPVDVDLACGAFVSGCLVAVEHWEAATGGEVTEESRRVWDGLLDRMAALARAGYAPVPTGSGTDAGTAPDAASGSDHGAG